MRPVRVTVSDDLRRERGTVFFRAWLALPFLVWVGLYAIAAFFAALASWAATLARGRSPAPLHRFLARFVRLALHVHAFFNLAAEPFPRFDARPGYPIEVEIGPPARQRRWRVALRLLLALPAFLLLGLLAGPFGDAFALMFPWLSLGGISLLGVATLLAWFYALARGRMSRGLRDLIAYALSYAAQFWAYLLLLSDRYPSSDPQTAIGRLPVRDDPVQMEVRDELRRSRLTVFFRLPLAFPHLAWLTVWGAAALLAAVANWLATLAAGRSPRLLHRFLAAYLRYQTHVGAFLYLVGNPFPGFTGNQTMYPVELRVAERARQSRWKTALRLVLAWPALLLAGIFGWLLLLVALLGWFAALATGRMPLGLRNAGALALRYTAQTYGYLYLLTDAYPYSGPCLAPPAGAAEPAAEPPAPLGPPAPEPAA
jgi:hypothetical protein